MAAFDIDGYKVQVDPSDLARVCRHSWQIQKNKWGIYVRTMIKKRKVYLHRFILDAPKGSDVDHKNRDGLDNRRANLRICTRSQNNMNAKRKSNSSSPYKGVVKLPSVGRRKIWNARITHEGKVRSLGYFMTAIEAVRAYNAAALRCFGGFARLNEI